MAERIIHWPSRLLNPGGITVAPVPFTRGGGRSLGGIDRAVRTDRGFWSVTLSNIPVREFARRRTWNAIRSSLGGRAGLIMVPAWSYDTAPWVDDMPVVSPPVVPHSDGSTFDDGTMYQGSSIVVKLADAAAIGATSVVLEIVSAGASLAGTRWSYQGALYETAAASDITGSFWTMPVFPAIRAPIPAGVMLEFDLPTCLARLAEDRAMEIDLSPNQNDLPTVRFHEAVDYWSDLAAGLIE